MSAPMLLPSLRDLCVKAVSTQPSPELGGLPAQLKQQVTENLELDLPLELAGQLISDEEYWQKRAQARWRSNDVTGHGQSWKQLYFEQHLQEVLELWDPATSDLPSLKRLLCFSRRYVQCLRLRQLPSHLDLQLLFDCMLSTPMVLSATYGRHGVGMGYDASLFGMALPDVHCLARALGRTETLVLLELPGNGLDDDMARLLASGLADNISITSINLSHNMIGDRGAKALARVLDANSVVAALDLTDNSIHEEGGRALGRALLSSRALATLTLRLNRLGAGGCAALCEALAFAGSGGSAVTSGNGSIASSITSGGGHGSSGNGSHTVRGDGGSGAVRGAPLEVLSLAANSAGPGCVASLVAMLRMARGLTSVDVSSNPLGGSAGPELRSALAANAGLRALEVRGCGLGAEDDSAVREELLARKEKAERLALLAGAGGRLT